VPGFRTSSNIAPGTWASCTGTLNGIGRKRCVADGLHSRLEDGETPGRSPSGRLTGKNNWSGNIYLKLFGHMLLLPAA
jgi:hypothetical protein